MKVVCPHCTNKFEIVDDATIYNLNRTGKALYKCDCGKTFLVHYDGENVKCLRVSKK